MNDFVAELFLFLMFCKTRFCSSSGWQSGSSTFISAVSLSPCSSLVKHQKSIAKPTISIPNHCFVHVFARFVLWKKCFVSAIGTHRISVYLPFWYMDLRRIHESTPNQQKYNVNNKMHQESWHESLFCMWCCVKCFFCIAAIWASVPGVLQREVRL